MDFLDKLGIDWRLFTAQLINFAILFFVLHRFLYRPILRVLEERRKQITQNAEKTKSIEEQLQRSHQVYEERIEDAERKAQEIIKMAEETARSAKDEIIEKAQASAERYLADARIQAEREREKTLLMVREESQTIVKSAVLQVLQSATDKELAQRLYLKGVEKLKTEKL